MLEAGLIALIQSDPTVAGLIANRIFALVLPENTVLPAATYQIASGNAAWTFDSKVQRRKRVQFDFWADSQTGKYADAKQLEQSVLQVLDGFTGTLPDGSRVLTCFRGAVIDSFQTSARYFRVMNEYEISYVE